LAKAEYFDTWRTAWFFRAAGQIPIRRSGGDASQRALDTAAEVLGAGRLLGLYPEGTRSSDRFVHKGRTGVARLAAECRVAVIPVGIIGTVRVQPVGARMMRPFRRVTVRFGEPMMLLARVDPATGRPVVDPADARRFTDQLMHRIAELSERPYLDQYIASRSTSDPGVGDEELPLPGGPRSGPAAAQA
jgi:1-acyl-sn-glycerol-3-phosphate acyltransferase